ncbi:MULTISPECIES: hypothetical protein [Sporosarcina]|uniref:hypothetical protein n=1 Tax=Sporosarcina TaxID=1569 RepID=UPI00058BF196|nr:MULTISPECIES: hypothetical protein [Sporosarcina]WJY27233.1 Fe3+ hydroxamate ABC transporter substrate-binding protein [Sporosarcina sp. 0.2-SM1T-5]
MLDRPKCDVCGKEIKDDGTAFVKLHYPKKKGFTEIKAYMKNEGTFICEDCDKDDSK